MGQPAAHRDRLLFQQGPALSAARVVADLAVDRQGLVDSDAGRRALGSLISVEPLASRNWCIRQRTAVQRGSGLPPRHHLHASRRSGRSSPSRQRFERSERDGGLHGGCPLPGQRRSDRRTETHLDSPGVAAQGGRREVVSASLGCRQKAQAQGGVQNATRVAGHAGPAGSTASRLRRGDGR